MAFLDSFKRGKETDVKEKRDVPISAANQILESTHLKQVPFRSAADLLGSRGHSGRPFKLTANPAPVERSVRMPNRVPTTGERVITKYNGIVLYLKEALMTDHISITYATNHVDFFAKIYIVDVLRLDMLENKANRMLHEKIEIPGVCWPIDILNDNNGYFVGILVPVSRGIQLTRSIFNGATGLSQFFPQWNKIDLYNGSRKLSDSCTDFYADDAWKVSLC